MNKALSFVKLDFLTVKPYLTLKSISLFAVIILIMAYSTSDSGWTIGFYTFFLSTIYISYPFAVGEQNGIDMLYSTLSIRRDTVVLGRYLFSLSITAMSGVMVYIFTLAGAAAFQTSFDYTEGLIVIAAIFVVSGIVQAFQLPVYFRLGYAKAKMLVYIPFIVFSGGIVGLSMVFKESDITRKFLDLLTNFAAKPALLVALGVGVWLIALGISYKVSLMFYKKRDF